MASVTVSRDGDVAVITLSNPPLNLFGPDSFDELDECIAEVEASDARAAVWRAEGDIFTGGVDVQVFADAVASGEGRGLPVAGRAGQAARGAGDADRSPCATGSV